MAGQESKIMKDSKPLRMAIFAFTGLSICLMPIPVWTTMAISFEAVESL
jgi:hypothetical protein